MQYPQFDSNNNSLMAKHLSKELFEQLKEFKTQNDFTLEAAINSGVLNKDSSIGIYAGDKESYSKFNKIFDPIIQEYHHFSKEQEHLSSFNMQELKAESLEDFDKYIISTRIRVGRNLDEFPLGPAISKKQREEIEQLVSSTLLELEDELKGNYYSLDSLKQEDKEQLIKDHFLFKQGDRFLEAAGLNRDWPSGRGIFHNLNKTFLVWINEEDQLRIISMQKGGDIKAVFKRLKMALEKIEQKLEFSKSKHLGYITSCPTNLGTAMRASVHIKLPNLGKNREAFEKIVASHHLQIRGIHGEHSQSEDGIFDISNKRRLGISEIQCVQDMYDGVVALIQKEKELE